MIKKLLTLFILLQFYLFPQHSVFTQFNLENDNDRQSVIKLYLGVNVDISKKFQAGVMSGIRSYNIPNEKNVYNDFRPFITFRPADNLTFKFNTSYLISEDWKPVFFDGLITYTPIDLLYIEGYIERESIGSAQTNNLKYISNSMSASLDLNLTRSLVVTGGFTYNEIANTDFRTFQTYRIIYTFLNSPIFVDFKAKLMRGGDYNPNYFSPNSLDEYNFGIGYGTEIVNSQYYLRVYLGSGSQLVDDAINSLYIFNLRFAADFTPKLSGILTFGASNAATNSYGTYLYTISSLQLNYYF